MTLSLQLPWNTKPVKIIGTGRDNIKAGVFSGWELGDYIYLRSEEAYMIKMEALAHKVLLKQ
nr:hypothetical protein [Bacteroides sp. CACC 737]